jgi:hypothetical protein
MQVISRGIVISARRAAFETRSQGTIPSAAGFANLITRDLDLSNPTHQKRKGRP